MEKPQSARLSPRPPHPGSTPSRDHSSADPFPPKVRLEHVFRIRNAPANAPFLDAVLEREPSCSLQRGMLLISEPPEWSSTED